MIEDTQRQIEKVRNTSDLSESEIQSRVDELERYCVSKMKL